MSSTKCGFNSVGNTHGSDLLVYRGPTLHVCIGFDPDWTSGKTPKLAVETVNALVDTGATESCIDRGLAMQLNLPIVDQVKVSGISGAHDTNMHLAQIHIPSLNFTLYGQFAAVDLIAGGQPYAALIGRTFLKAFTMVYEGMTGTVTLTRA